MLIFGIVWTFIPVIILIAAAFFIGLAGGLAG
jgi:hypothetical protein